MVNESDDRYENHEDGEYHFSDEHSSYEVETETPRAAAVAAIKTSPLNKLGGLKRVGIATAVFFTLMIIVYKILTPSSSLSTPNTDITQAVVPPATTKPVTVAQPKPAVTQQTQAAPATTAPITTQPVVAVQSPPVQQSMQPTQPTVAPTVMLPTSSVAASSSTVDAPNKEIVDRIAAVEQQNSKLANVLQIEYAQRMNDYESQSTATQAKLRELNTRVANIEASLNQIMQLLQGGTNKSIQVSPSSTTNGLPAAKPVDPKQNYTVQAIIPGRAWLKSDTGDTVTVAEGDVLRDYGRIAKIDPYDGVVEIDTGSKVVSLSYGSGND